MLVGIGDDLFEKVPVVCEQTFDGRFREEVCAVEEKTLKTTGHIPHVAFEIESCRQALKLLHSERKAGQLQLLQGRILQSERDLKNRVAAEVARGLQFFDDSFKG